MLTYIPSKKKITWAYDFIVRNYSWLMCRMSNFKETTSLFSFRNTLTIFKGKNRTIFFRAP